MKGLTITITMGQILLILIFWQKLPPEIPLFYSRPWGKEQLVSPLWLFLLPILSFFVFLINSIISNFSNKEEKLIQKVLEVSPAIFSLLCLITLIKIIFLII